MIIMGVDPGYARVGVGIIRLEKGMMKHVFHTCIETHKGTPFEERLKIIADEFKKILEHYKPEKFIMEKLYFAKNTTTALDVAHARGVLLLVGTSLGAHYLEITPNQVKQGLTGYGGADKKQMQHMVKMQLNLKEIPKPDDAADALALAIAGSVYR